MTTPATAQYEYMDAAVVAKHLRKRLKTEYPETKFSVRTHKYSMGASINIEWTDGPLAEDIDKIAHHYAGATFDGMQDLKSYKEPVGIGGKLVHPGADYVFTRRNISPEVIELNEKIAAAYLEVDTIEHNKEYDDALLNWRGMPAYGYEVGKRLANNPSIKERMVETLIARMRKADPDAMAALEEAITEAKIKVDDAKKEA